MSHTVDFDTGSSDLFVPSTSCGSTCSGHNEYDPDSSSTSCDLKKTFELAYGDGSTVEGEEYTDVVTVAGLTVRGAISCFPLFLFKALTGLTIGGYPDAWRCNPVFYWVRN